MSNHEVESLVKGRGGLGSGSHSSVFLVYSMISHIDAWNMTQGCLAKRNIWFSPIYGRVVHGSPRPSCISHMSLEFLASYILWINLLVIM